MRLQFIFSFSYKVNCYTIEREEKDLLTSAAKQQTQAYNIVYVLFSKQFLSFFVFFISCPCARHEIASALQVLFTSFSNEESGLIPGPTSFFFPRFFSWTLFLFVRVCLLAFLGFSYMVMNDTVNVVHTENKNMFLCYSNASIIAFLVLVLEWRDCFWWMLVLA